MYRSAVNGRFGNGGGGGGLRGPGFSFTEADAADTPGVALPAGVWKDVDGVSKPGLPRSGAGVAHVEQWSDFRDGPPASVDDDRLGNPGGGGGGGGGART